MQAMAFINMIEFWTVVVLIVTFYGALDMRNLRKKRKKRG